MSSNLNLIPRIRELYQNGDNIIDFLKRKNNRENNSIHDILISYDFQAGSYIKTVEKESPVKYIEAMVRVFNAFEGVNSVMEVGVGEATTLAPLVPYMDNYLGKSFYGFDISWSRVFLGLQYLSKKGINADLFVGDLFNIPLQDNAIDLVYTSHSLEPNGGREKEAIKELYRITNKYLVLLEPTKEFASKEGIARMEKLGYVSGLKATIQELGYHLIAFRVFDEISNPLNPTGLYVIEKNKKAESNEFNYACPISKTNLLEYNDHFYSKESFVAYPKIMNIPCLCEFYGVLA